MTKVYPMTPEGIERMWRDAIAEQVRRHCTPSPEAYAVGGDTLIAAVADWIGSPPEWIAAPDHSPYDQVSNDTPRK